MSSDLSRRSVIAGTLTVIAGSEAAKAVAADDKSPDKSPASRSDAGGGVDNEVGYHEFPEAITAMCALPGSHNVAVACGNKLYIVKIL